MNKEEQLFCNRIKELSYLADQRGYQTFTDFLNLNERNIIYSIEKELPILPHLTWGGYEEAERIVVCFDPYGTVSKEEFEVVCLEIQPLNKKFYSDVTHRDYLGAILNLGIDRCKVGDIIIKDKIAYVFVKKVISIYIMDHLNKVRHTNVAVRILEQSDFTYQPTFQEIGGSISSNRLDSLIALAFQTSRSSITGLIAGGKVFVNSKLVETNSYIVKEGDIVSVRGYGKFQYEGIKGTTRKGRCFATVKKYI